MYDGIQHSGVCLDHGAVKGDKAVDLVLHVAELGIDRGCKALLLCRADLFIVQWESMLEVYPKAVYGGWIF